MAALSRCITCVEGLTLLITSRAPLHLSGEVEYALGPLKDTDAVELFLTRARAVRQDLDPDQSTATVICRRLDGLPLALELAAARTKLLAPPALLQRVDKRIPVLTGGSRDMPARQRTLAATIDWSYHLLTVEDRELFARLSIFTGGFSLGAAEQVCECSLDDLASLVDMSLLKPIGEDRFLMLETLREYAAERLTVASRAMPVAPTAPADRSTPSAPSDAT